MRVRRGNRFCFALTFLVALAGCTSRGALDPRTAASGGALSAHDRATDVRHYELTLEVFPKRQAIQGVGVTVMRALEPLDTIEIDLDSRFTATRVQVDGSGAEFSHQGGAIEVLLPETVGRGEEVAVAVSYRGRPHVAARAPWDGGFVWSQNATGRAWIATANQGEGCDLWWPCKDHFADKPDSMDMHVTVPGGLSVALNGVLQSIDALPDGRRTFHWRLGVPISAYNVSLNIGPFERIEMSYEAVNGARVPIEFWALEEHEAQVRQLIEDDLLNQLAWYETVLGPYPWGGEKLGFVETPHLGMEHQTLNAYGNRFRRDDHGFDWLLQHELAHEWFGNLMTHQRANDAWLHEGFGAYMQPAYSLDRDGEAAYLHRLYESYLSIRNCAPVVPDGELALDDAFTGDIYAKGAWFLHTLRWQMGEEPFWRATRRLLYDTAEPWNLPYPIAPIYRSTDDFARITSEEAGRDLGWMFDVYLREADLPTLIEERSAEALKLSWQVPGEREFPMPVPVRVDGADHLVEMQDGEGAIQIGPETRVLIDPGMKLLRRLPIIGTCEQIETERKAE